MDNNRMNVVAAGSGAGFASTAFFARLFDEALTLVRDSRDYIAQRGRDDSRALPPAGGLAYSVETMRLTTRMTHIMAWLLMQRAYAEGEYEDAPVEAGAMRLGGADVCLGEPVVEAELPSALAELMRRSERLFRRIQRLDDDLEGQAGG
ncbi:MAG: DUF1465 family protein [Alphaproteobacteria bacterium]